VPGRDLYELAALRALAARDRLLRSFVARWRQRLPGSDPARALDAVWPIAALRQALIYRTFLDGIESAERIYHAGDVPNWLRRALERDR
jgi:hypothetical protein